ncbi:PREDICTED: LOW QUALITY PROTEIN: mucin-16 [Eufriesea mexicana]|uniref:LOW QUALITY PROTEIN: mucin-16 n=1 Tax=Eufriesea mexicana TaxID=516756 RepID=UPI00083C7A90|nr:PREDICTED: LOW QUALITY PROTEIN: mucin-16 [Eufriesea mexicana]
MYPSFESNKVYQGVQNVQENAESLTDDRPARIERDLQGVTTVLLVPARPGKSNPPVGLLTKTARTFVQDGASTEFATQVHGTTLDNGRLYARILSTSSRVFYDKKPTPDSATPYVVYPTRTADDDWQLKVALDNAPIKALKDIEDPRSEGDQENDSDSQNEREKSPTKLDELSRENDIFSKREFGSDSQRFKPAKVRPADNLPTYTVTHEYVTNNFDNLDEDQPKSFRPRLPKIFKPQPKAPAQKKVDLKPLPTVTYHGFADFTTTVGETVIVFSPSTSPAPVGRPATTIKGDATLRPDDGVAVVKIRPTSMVTGQDKTKYPPRISDPTSETGDPLLDAINRANIQPGVTENFEAESSTKSTEPLLLIPDMETASLEPTGLLKVVDSTTSSDGTTTHYKTLIYGTYMGTNYAQIIRTSSNVYFFPDEATATYGIEDTTVDYGTTGTEEPEVEQDSTLEMTTGTTPRIITTSEEAPQEIDELTTPSKGTTDSVLTTLKDILQSARRVLGTTESAAPTLDDEIPNDIAPGDPQGRSIKGGSSKNDLGHQDRKEQVFVDEEEKVILPTRLLPSTVYKTYTYFTTFFIPNGDQTTTSVRTNEVVSSEVSYFTELIRPDETESVILPTAVAEPPTTTATPSLPTVLEEEQTTKQDEEIELIFKTLYTTYTYLTTFFQESTSSISSREVVETNVITQTVGPNGASAVVAGLFGKDEPTVISPTRISDTVLPSITPELEEGTERYQTTMEQTTEEVLTTLQEQDTTTDQNIPTESGASLKDFEDVRQTTPEIEPSPTPVIPTQEVKEQIKTYYTTYTYFTTIFVDNETEIETRTEVFSNVVTETIQPTPIVPLIEETELPTTPKAEPAKPAVPPEILAYLEALQKQKSQEEALQLAKRVQQQTIDKPEDSEAVTEAKAEVTTESPTTITEVQTTTENLFRDFEVNAQVTPNPPFDGEILGSMVTDVVSSSSSGGGTVLDVMDKRNAVPEDQELSESNHHEVEPAPTLLLQTSYTTFTYFTTMYKGDESNVVSRLETVTNVATETIRPTSVVPMETSTLPVTYFTTFTYWTTFYKGGDTVTTSREETVSDVVTPGVAPTPTVELGVVMTYRPTTDLEDSVISEKESKITADNEVTPSNVVPLENSKAQEPETTSSKDIATPTSESSLDSTTVTPEPTTYYTTYTYFTTSYIGNETILNSRLETVTSVSIPEVLATEQAATGRAIDGPVFKESQTTKEIPITPSKTIEPPKIGLISTIRSSEVHDGTTTHFTTDVHGTYIDGLYAQVVTSTSRLETPPLPSPVVTPALPTGVLSMNKGSVIEADEVTTIYFTTKQIGTLYDGLYAKVIESTSSTSINEEKKATVVPIQGHRTGLVRLIQGQIENNGTTTFYQSKVIGTNIEGRYAQIIESTSSFLYATPTLNIAPTSTLPPTKSTEIPEISPSPAVIQSSLPDDPTTESPNQDDNSEQNEESEEDDKEGDGDQSSKKKSRLTFPTKKRTFTPAIRPFLPGNRPTFSPSPKRKGPQGATTITRTDITPTITATLAGKGNRFAPSRGRITSPIGPYSSTLSPLGSRRFSGRRGSPNTASSFSSTVTGSTRGRPQTRISPSSVFQGNRRGPTSIRGSSARAASRASSSVYPGASTRYRPAIRPSSTLLRGQSTVRHDDQENDANEFTTTTLVTEETTYTEDVDGGETVTSPLQTTTESSRRSTNPLLRFRRPINLSNSGRSSTTPRPPTTTRRNGNLNRPTVPTVSKATSGRNNGRINLPVSTRPRQSSTGLFPPRGLLGKKQELPTEEQVDPSEESESEGEENFEDEVVEEITDNDYEGSEHEDRTAVNRRSGKSIRPTVQIRPFNRARRVRRQASQLRSLTSRFRRPSQSSPSKAEDKSDASENLSSKEETSKSNTKPIARYNNRGRSLTSSRPPSKSSNNPEKTSAESTELSQSKARNRSKQPTSNGDRNSNSRIKPTTTSNNGRQFTLREKDGSSTARSSYKRPSTSPPRSNGRSTNNAERVRPPRLRNGSNKAPETTSTRRVPPSSRATTRAPSRNGNRRGSTTTRSRGSLEDIREAPTVYPDFDGTITVTHYVPTEVTIPVVNNGITEHRNIVTAQASTEILGPTQYSTVTGGDGKPLVVIASEVTGTNPQGQTEVTRFLLHETPTTRVSHTLTTLGGRRASQSVIVPTTVYSVENVVSTVQPALPGNAPLANLLLSQLLLGQLGQANPLLQPQATPSTQYNTRTTSYVTTITKQRSTVIPLTFRGKEIVTTLVDTSTDVVTATEFITDTVVVTPTAALPAANLNSLLLLLQQPQPQQNTNPLLDPVFAAPPFTQSNTLPGEVESRHQPADSDYKHDSYEYSDEEEDAQEYHKASRPRNGRIRTNDRKEDHSTVAKEESSVVTLYVSGRRPGEFSTVLSTVRVSDTVSSSRRRRDTGEELVVEVQPSIPPTLHEGSEGIAVLTGSEDSLDAHTPTQSLESVRENVAFSDDYPDDYYRLTGDVASKRTWSPDENARSQTLAENNDDYLEETPRKRVRIRVPVVRKNPKQHKLTVVRRRPIATRAEDPTLTVARHTPRRIVVTRVRTLGLANTIHSDLDPDSLKHEIGRHKVTITRRRKIESTPVLPTSSEKKPRITRKKLIAVRPVQPTPAFAIITTGFFTAPSSESEEEYSEEVNNDEMENKEDVSSTVTPELVEPPNVIDSRPDEVEVETTTEEMESKVIDPIEPIEETTVSTPVIITDNFFLPASADEYEEYEEEYTDTTTESAKEDTPSEETPTTTVSTKVEDVPSTENISTTPATPDLIETTTEKPEEVSDKDTDHETTTESVDVEDEEKTEEISTTVKFIDDVETLTTTQEVPKDSSEEDVTTTAYPETEDEDEEENEEEEERTTTVESMETTVPMEETTVISVPEEEIETTTSSDIETTTTASEEDEYSTTEQFPLTTEPTPEDSSSEDEESKEEDMETDVTTVASEPEVAPPNDTEYSPEKHEKSNDIIVETDSNSLTKDVEDSPKMHVETHVSVSQSGPEDSHQTRDEDVPEKAIEPHVTKVQSESQDPPRESIEDPNKDTQSPDLTATQSPKPETESSFPDVVDFTTQRQAPEAAKTEENEDVMTVEPIQPIIESASSTSTSLGDVSPSFATVLPLETFQTTSHDSTTPSYLDDSEIPSVIPLGVEYTSLSDSNGTPAVPEATPRVETATVTTSITSPTPEEIEAGLADDLYLSLSRPDFPEILPSKPVHVEHETRSETPELEPSTSVYYTETVVTSTRLRTYTYVVTQLNGQETKVTSSTTVRPRVTTLTLTVPVTVTVTPTVESSVSSVYSPVPAAGEYDGKDEEGRRFNLATRVMSNGVEVIVAGPTPALRWENLMPQPTLTLSDAVVMMLPQDKPNEFVTKTCTTTFTYLTTITKDGTTTVSTEEQVIANTATEERHRKPGSETAAVTLDASPTLRTEVFKTTYTYLTLNTDHPILEPSEAPRPETNTYLSTRMLEKTFMEDGRTRVETTSDTITQLIVTESAPPPRPTRITTTLTALDSTEENMTDVMKTYYITYTYYNTFLEKGNTVVRTNVATSTDVVLEKVPVKKTTKTTMVNPTPEPIQIFATKTYLTTFTYFTTLLQAGPDEETSTTVSSRSHIVENVVTESIAPSLLDAGYMNALLTTAHHTDPVKNVVTGSTIIFFDEEDQIDPTTTTSFPEATSTAEVPKDEVISASFVSTEPSPVASEANLKPSEQISQETNVTVSSDSGQNKKPAGQNTSDLQVSNLLNLGSLGINSLSALGPVITAMAGLLQGKTTATRRNDTIPQAEAQEVTTQRSPIYIPVAEFADDDIEAAESQNIGTHLTNVKHNYIAETRHKVASSLADGIPISPGEVITANSDVIIGKPGKMAPRPPQTFLEDEEHIGMKPPPLPVPNILVHPVLEVLENNREDSQPQQTLQGHKGPQIQIYPAHQIYEEHLKIPVSMPVDTNPTLLSKQPQKLLPIQSSPPKRMGSKQDVMENDPLLKPPDRPNVEQYANPNSNPKEPEWSPEKSRRPWSAKDPLKLSPPHPQFDQKIDAGKPPMEKPWPTVPSDDQKRPPWAQKDPLLPDSPVVIQISESRPTPAEPIVHQVPHVIDRSTGQPLLVNIQPSQVANVVIPQGGTQALIFGDTNEPHISGQYFDDPSPYPESEVGLGFVGIQRVEDLPQYSNGKDPADYMVPPSPPHNFKTLPEKHPSNRPATIPLSPGRFDYERPQDKLEAPLNRPEKKPSDVHLIKHPDNSGVLGGQGHVHTEILVHHRPETVNVRPQSVPYPSIHPHMHPNGHLPSRGQFPKIQKPVEPGTPPRRTEMSNLSDNSHRYILLAKPDSGNEIVLNTNWKSDKKPPRILMNNRLRPRPILRSTTSRPLDRPIYQERPNIRKPVYNGPQRPPTKTQNTNTFVLPHRPIANPQIHHEPPRIATSTPGDVMKDVVTERQPSYGPHPQQIDLQDRPPHFYPEKRPANVGQMRPQTERTEEYVPTGAVEYHNPSNTKIKQDDRPAATNTQVQSFDQASSSQETKPEVWQSGTQTEKTLDSEIGASEPVNYHNQVKEVQKYDKTQSDMPFVSKSNDTTSSIKNSAENVASGNTVIRKPAGGSDVQQDQKGKPVWMNPGVPFSHKNEASQAQVPYGPSYYNTKPHETPVVQGKPFGVYTGHEETNYGYKWKENKPEHDIVQGVPSTYYMNKILQNSHKNQQEQTSTLPSRERDDTIDLKPPAIIPQFVPELDKPSRPYPRPPIINKVETRPVLYPRPDVVSQAPETRPDQVKQPNEGKPASSETFVNNSLGHPGKMNQSHLQLGGFVDLNLDGGLKISEQRPDRQEILVNKSEVVKNHFRNNSISHQVDNQYPQTTTETIKTEKSRPKVTQQEYGSVTRIHPEYPHIVTKPKPPVPGPVTISTANKPDTRPNIRFSMPVEAIGEEVDSKTQTERPPSMLITTNNSSDKKKNPEKIDTSYQTNFAASDANKEDSVNHETKIRIRPIETSTGDMLSSMEGMNVPSRDMMPPPLRPAIGLNQSNKNEEEDLKPPPIPSRDVVGLSPPPVDITTTSGPAEDRFPFVTANESGLKPPPKYIPLKESTVAPLPSVSMVPPSPRPSLARPFIVELLSQDMVPPPPVTQTTRPLEIATVRPAVAVSGSIQIATAVATSHIPVVQDIESKIPIIHGTVDLPVIVDVPEILRPVETRMTEHVSIYTVRPFDTRPVSRISVQPTTMTTNLVIPTKLRPIQLDQIQPSRDVEPTRSHNFDIPRNPVKRPEHPVFLESSHDNVLPTTKVEATETLTHVVTTSQKTESRPTMTKNEVSKVVVSPVTERKRKNETTVKELPSVVTRVDSSVTNATSTLSENVTKRNESVIKMTKDVSSQTTKPVHGTTTTMRVKPKEVTRFQTSTVTRIQTSVLGSPPTTRTLLLTHTLTSTTVETVTETLLRPTSVVSTVTSTILQPVVTRVPPSYENVVDNDSIFVVMSDQKPPAPGAEEVEAEYGDITRDEQDPTENKVHKVLAGGVLGAPVVSLQPIINQCTPECRASRAEICAEVGSEMRCVCRPGFARMFPDRPCKPTYTYTLRVGLDRIGHEPVVYESSLNDSSSTTFRKLVGPTKDALDRTLMQSDLRDIYRGLNIAGFSPDPTKVVFHVQLSDNANETRLKEVLRKYLIASNYSLGGTEVYASKNLEIIEAVDFDECEMEEGGPHHDCSQNAACFNLRGSYQCSCKEGWADLSENPAYPGRLCSQAPLGCPSCNNKGHCVTNTNGQEVCECFPWHSGQRCQVNLKVLLIALVTTGTILLGVLGVCVGMACFRQPNRRAMIPGTGGDTSSEGSVTDLAIPHHVPHVLPPPPQMMAPLPPTKRPARKSSSKPRHPPRKTTMIPASVPVSDEQRDRSLTVMIPRAKYRSAPQSPQNYKSGMSTFSTEEHKLLNYLESGTHNTGNRKQSVSSAKDCKEADVQIIRTPAAPTGALVSAGFQVSATVTRQMDADSTLARSCGETTVETATKVLRTGDLQADLCSTLARSCGETTIQAPTKLLRLDLGEAGSTLARSCGETTIQPPTKVADARRNSVKDARDNRDTRDSASEGHTMAERDLGSTLRLPAQHPPLYSPDRTSDRESNFDSL